MAAGWLGLGRAYGKGAELPPRLVFAATGAFDAVGAGHAPDELFKSGLARFADVLVNRHSNSTAKLLPRDACNNRPAGDTWAILDTGRGRLKVKLRS